MSYGIETFSFPSICKGCISVSKPNPNSIGFRLNPSAIYGGGAIREERYDENNKNM